jgi:hypothetical protein
VPATVHLLAAQPPDVCPLLEYLSSSGPHQPVVSQEPDSTSATVRLPYPMVRAWEMELDEDKIMSRREMDW